MSTAIDTIKAQTDLDLMMARRAFAVAQASFAGATLRIAADAAAVDWHDSDLYPETGSVALVREDGPYADLVGEIIKFTRPMPLSDRVVYAYLIATAPILADFSLGRRAFLGLGILANEGLTCAVEVVA